MLIVPFDVGTLLANANVLRKFGLTRSTGEGRMFSFTLRERTKKDRQRSNAVGSPEATVQVTVSGLEE